jgi:hypothetical protein
MRAMLRNYTVYQELNATVFVCHGAVNVADNRVALLCYIASPEFKSNYNVLIDLAGCSFPDIYFNDMLLLAYQLEPYYSARDPDSRTAIYAPDDVSYGMSRIYQSVAESRAPFEIEVFRTIPAALTFVRIDPTAPASQGLLRPG